MSLDSLIMLSGAFVALLPFLGFPNSWDNVLLFLAGIFVIALGIIVRRRETHSINPGQKKDKSAFRDASPLSPPHENA
ncbi:hypothetical protein A3C86_00990 [Candidatus Kaiserbacteria bacterium RIFCSPHIGHO2_02_FULL_49_16]|uniref:Uncharacterized protein n=1 Tax=Candidatus Kaiserbacteria bacterium RIFCSPHIGHO2_02_FULL_49_16 TaxID=1798490 RepID=A0A1F6DEW5_9BACT|nr:MAG: hypothetical protein A3C86_00990 [Candidatus Kaiserbacteria bacterium RIFCSPHIGHO2_02_FULL_49_16]